MFALFICLTLDGWMELAGEFQVYFWFLREELRIVFGHLPERRFLREDRINPWEVKVPVSLERKEFIRERDVMKFFWPTP